MGWEDRNGRQYYYKKRRVGRHVVSEYIGSGPLAELEEIQAKGRAVAKAEHQPLDNNPELDSLLDQLAGNIQTITRAYLLAAGYHQHKGQWRKKREN